MELSNILNIPPGLQILILAWSIFWKIVAVWRAAKLNQKYWFIALFVINTFGVVEILYLFVFAKEKIKPQDFKPANLLPSKI